jgi:spore germination protein KC
VKKQVSLLICAAIMLAVTAGCWNYRELEQRGLVCCVGIDRAAEAGKFKMTASVIRPGEVSSAGGQGGVVRAKEAYYTATGRTIFETTRNFLMQSNRRLFWGHNRNLIIGEAVAREGVFLLIDRFIRGVEPRLRTWVFVAKGTEAKEIVETVAKMESGLGPELDALIKSSATLSAVPRIDLKLFTDRLNSKTTAAVAPRLELIRAGEKTDAGDYPGSSGPAGAAEPKLQRLRLAGTAVFKGDRLAGWLNKPESRGLLWVMGKAQSGIIVVKCPGDESNLASLELIELVSKIKPEKRDGKIMITMEIKTENNLVDQQGTADLSTPEALRSLGRRHATVVKNEIRAAIDKAREYRADIFGFGEAIGRKFPQEWKELESRWDEAFQELEIDLKVKSRILRIGRISKPVGAR